MANDVGSSPYNRLVSTINMKSQIDPAIINAVLESHKAGEIPIEELIALNHFCAQQEPKIYD